MGQDRSSAADGESRPTPALGVDEDGHWSAGVRASLVEYLHACPVCRNSVLLPYCRVPSLFRTAEFIRYDRCRGCGVVFRNPRLPTARRLDAYRERKFGPERMALDPRTQAHYGWIVRRLCQLRAADAGTSVFDFGCGAGGFLHAAKSAGLSVYGLELNRDFARHVRETYGIPVHCGEIADSDFPDLQFDLITSFEVFEHLVDPGAALRGLVAHLRPGGLLLIEVPNLRDFRERIRRGATMDDSHLFYFSRASLVDLLVRHGLEVVEVHEGVRPYRLLGKQAARLPVVVYRAFERAMNAIQLRTVLGVIARRQPARGNEIVN